MEQMTKGCAWALHDVHWRLAQLYSASNRRTFAIHFRVSASSDPLIFDGMLVPHMMARVISVFYRLDVGDRFS